jgi:hypothetical protein
MGSARTILGSKGRVARNTLALTFRGALDEKMLDVVARLSPVEDQG